MKNSWVLVPFLLLAACGQPSQPADGTAAAPEDEGSGEIVTPGDTHLVANPPTYESVPLPDGLEWLTNDSDPGLRVAGCEARRHAAHLHGRLSADVAPLRSRLEHR